MGNGELFDKYIKATLENGTEDVPAGLWDSIQERITADKPKGLIGALAGLGIRWKRAAVGIALACVAVAAVVLSVPRATVTSPQQEITIAEAAPAEPATDIEEQSIPETVPAAAPMLALSKKPATIEEKPVIVEDKPAAIEEETVFAEKEPVIVEDKTAVTEEKTVVSEKETVIVEKPEIAQPFIFDEREPVRRKRMEMSAYANGADNIGETRYNYGRLSTSQMTFGQNESLTETEALNYMIPVSAGVAVRYNFTERWALSVGLNYTFLNRHFKGMYDYGGIENYQCDNINNDQHFVGIPINAFYTIHSGERVKFYASLGGAIEKCVYNKYSFNYTPRNRKTLNEGVAGVQASIGVGLGMQINLTNHLGLYIDPGLRYYFKNYLQPKSIRTVQPLQLGLELGLRWDL